jgi:Uma2 family endonuclease
MSTALEKREPYRSPENDPWRYGTRSVRRVGPGGRVRYELIPLRKEDLLFPQEGDRPVLTDDHSRDYRYLFNVLEWQAALIPGRRVFGDHRIDFEVPGIEPLGPDLIVLDGVGEWDGSRGTFPVVTMHARPLLVIEITSPDTRPIDLDIKPGLYFRCGVPFYVVVDRQAGRSRNEVRVTGFRATARRYVEIQPDKRGRLWLEPVQMGLGVANRCAVFYDRRGRRIRSAEERAAVEAKARRAAQVKASAEAKARRAAEAKLRELEAELRRLRGRE